MKVPNELLRIIEAEQERQKGNFLPADHAAYFAKLEKYAELVIHYGQEHELGFVFFYCNDPYKKNAYITLIAVTPEARGKGIGFALISYVLNVAKARGFSFCQLEVRKDNLKAINLYKKLGFLPIEDRGEKVLMSAPLNS